MQSMWHNLMANASGKWRYLMTKFWTNTSCAICWLKQIMQVAPSGGQICNLCKRPYLVAKFAINASGAIWWPHLQLMQVAPSGGQICNLNKWRHLVVKYATNVIGAMLLLKLIQVTESISGSVVPLAMFVLNLAWLTSSVFLAWLTSSVYHFSQTLSTSLLSFPIKTFQKMHISIDHLVFKFSSGSLLTAQQAKSYEILLMLLLH